MKTTEVGKLEIVRTYPEDTTDGFGTWIRIDGVALRDRFPFRDESKIWLIGDACKSLRIIVQFVDGTFEEFQPKQFEFSIGDVYLRIDPNRHPLLVTVGGHEPLVKRVTIRFEEGGTPCVDLKIRPKPSSEERMDAC